VNEKRKKKKENCSGNDRRRGHSLLLRARLQWRARRSTRGDLFHLAAITLRVPVSFIPLYVECSAGGGFFDPILFEWRSNNNQSIAINPHRSRVFQPPGPPARATHDTRVSRFPVRPVIARRGKAHHRRLNAIKHFTERMGRDFDGADFPTKRAPLTCIRLSS